MSGSDESLIFAQRLGIGRHVPCIVIFTDIGDLQVHVLPFHRQAASDVYWRIRDWTDSYYEINHDILEHWSSVETEVQKLARNAAGSLRRVSDWRRQRHRDWQNLRRIAQLIEALANEPDTAAERLTALAGDQDLPDKLRGRLRDYQTRLVDFDKQAAEIPVLMAAADDLAGRVTLDDVRRDIKKLRSEPPKYLHHSTSAAIQEAWTELRSADFPVSPGGELLRWWEKSAWPLFSKRQFLNWCAQWHAIVVTGRLADESMRDHKRRDYKRRDYAAFWGAVGAQQVTQQPERAADEIVSALAAYYHISASSGDWQSATGGFRAYLADAFGQLQASAPGWLLRSSRPLLVRECIPPSDGGAPALDFLKSSAELASLVRQAEIAAPSGSDRQAEYLRHRDLVSQALRDDARRLSTAEVDRRSAVAGLVTVLEAARADLQGKILDQAAKTGSLPSPIPDAAEFARLHASLDEYDQAVQRIVYPHLSDPMVIPVRIETNFQHAVRLAARDIPDPVAEIRTSMSRAAAESRKATDRWLEAQRDTARWSPASLLGDGLMVVLPPPRQEAILSLRPGESVPEKVNQLVRDGRTGSVLAAMTQAELKLLLKRLGGGEDTGQPDNGLRSAILVALGLGTRSEEGPGLHIGIPADAAQRLERKIKDNDFDVFMAHHSADKPAVLGICEFLRRQGIYPWVDLEQIPPGRWFQDYIESALLKVRAAAVFFGPEGIGQWQRLEIRTVVDLCVKNDIPVIPVLLPGVSEVPDQHPFMRGLHHVAFENTVFEEAPLRQLVWGITGTPPADPGQG